MKFIRRFTGDLDEPRFIRLGFRTRGVYDALCQLAGLYEAKGSFVYRGRQLSEEDLAARLHATNIEEFKADLKALRDAKLLKVNGRGLEIAGWESDQVDIDEIRAARRVRDHRYEEGKRRRDADASEDSRRHDADGHQSPEESPDQNPEETRGDQPPTLPPSKSRRHSSGGVAGPAPKWDAMLATIKPKERKRAEQVRPILQAAGLRQPALNTLTVSVATRISIGASDLIPYVLGVLASAYADERAKNKAAVAAHRLEAGSLSPEFKDPKRWRSIPAEVLSAAGIENLDTYIASRKYTGEHYA